MTRLKEVMQHGRGQIITILLAFVLLATIGSSINPLHEASDELRHYRFVQHIVQLKRLPVQGELPCQAQGHHPPLIYAIGALATFWIDTGRDVCYEPPTNPFWQYRYWEVGHDNKNLYLHGPDEAFPWSGEALAAHLVRLINVLFGAGTVFLTWLIARLIWPTRPSLALGSVAFVAFNPMFVYMSGAINNDIIAAFSGTAVVLASVWLLTGDGLSRWWGVIFGVLYAMALLSKFNLAPIGLIVAVTVSWVAWQKKQWRLWLEVGLLAALVTAVLAGWWFVRNQLLYGEPTGFEMLTQLWGAREPSESWGLAIHELPYTWTSLWGRFGYGQIPLPDGLYLGLRWLVGLGWVGLAVPFLRRSRPLATPIAVGLLLLDVLILFAVLFNYLLVSPAGAMGRFFFPALPALAILTFYGLSQWGELVWQTGYIGQWRQHRPPERPTFYFAWVVNGVMAGLTAVAFFAFLQPAYARPPSFNQPAPNPIEAQFDQFVVLEGYQINHGRLQPGDELRINLYWRVIAQPPGNYLLFTHLIDENGIIVAQRDTHPGLGNFPSSQWQAGDRFVDTVRLHMPDTMMAPSTATLSIGLYAPDAYRLGITAVDGRGLGDSLTLTTVDLQPAATDYPNALQTNFNNLLRLRGYTYNGRLFKPGDVLDVRLYWQALRPLSQDYEVELWVCDDPCERWMAPRATAVLPLTPATSQWTAVDVVENSYLLSLPGDLPAGSYLIHVALLDPVTKEPQNLLFEDGHIGDNRLLLARVRIAP